MFNNMESTELKQSLKHKIPYVLMALGLKQKARDQYGECFKESGHVIVSLAGPLAGQWRLFEDDIGGDIFDLIMDVNECDYSCAKEWAINFLYFYISHMELKYYDL